MAGSIATVRSRRSRVRVVMRRWLRLLRRIPAVRRPHRPPLLRYRAAVARAVLDNRPLPFLRSGRPASLRPWIRWQVQSLPQRLLTHGVTLAIALVVLLLPHSFVIAPNIIPSSSISVDPGIIAIAPLMVPLTNESIDAPVLQHVDVASTEIFALYHRVMVGDTLGQIAQHYRVSIDTIFWNNGLDADGLLAVDQELRVPRVSGLLYIVQPDDTLAQIAKHYGVPIEAITLFRPNRISQDADLVVGRELFIPGAVQPYSPEILQRYGGIQGIANLRAVEVGAVQEDETNLRSGPGQVYGKVALLTSGTLLTPIARHGEWAMVHAGDLGNGWVRVDLIALSKQAFLTLPETNDFPAPPPRWVWPTYGQITSPFGWRTVPFRSFHDGIDIANRAGTPILAARSGSVIEAGWCSGFGYCVKINHGGGVTTTYGHMLRQPRVAGGDTVAAGDPIGLMGSTYDRAGGGYSTGVHLHFTVKVDGKAVNPRKYLP